MLTSLYESGRFWLIDTVTFNKDVTFPSFASIRAARIAAGPLWAEDFVTC